MLFLVYLHRLIYVMCLKCPPLAHMHVFCREYHWSTVRQNGLFNAEQVEYLADGARVLNCTQHSCRPLGTLPKTCKKLGGRRWIFFAKSAERCFTPVIEIKHNSVSLRWNFYVDIQLIRGRFWLQLWTLKKFSESRVSWKYLAKMWKHYETPSAFAASKRRRWARLIGFVACVYL